MLNKILFILHIPPPVHGSSIIGLQIKNSLIINNEFVCRYVNLGTSTTVNEIGKRGVVKLFRFVGVLFSVLRQLIIFRPELCYFAITVKGPAFYKDAILVLLLKIFGVKLIFHLHNKGISNRQDKWLDNILYRIIFKNTTVILLSKYLYPDIEKYVSKESIYYCPNGIPDATDINLVSCLKKDKRIVNILFLSNLVESKGAYILLEACEILHKRELDFHCTFVGAIGDISEEHFKDKTQKLKIENRVAYLGKKYSIEKISEFANADIFSLPTYFDCFPLVLLEAMQHSLPIVSTFEGGIPDLVEDGITGFIVPEKNPAALADKLEILIKNPEIRKQMGNEGRRKYEKEFTLNVFETTLIRIIHAVLNKNRY